MSPSVNLKIRVQSLPDDPGVYIYSKNNGETIYIGKAISLRKRVASYFSAKDLGPKTTKMVSEIAKIDYIKVFSEFEALLLEAELIRSRKPFYNIQAKDDKSPIFITISKDDVPLISTARATNIDKRVFFVGPFPSAKITKAILKITRRIFPYCHHKNAKKPCLYVHLGLCPFPYSDGKTKENYQKAILQIKKFLKGKSKSLVRELTREMNLHAKKQEFERAAQIKQKIIKLQYLFTQYRMPREFLEKPNLVDDLSAQRLVDLKKILQLKTTPKRIECYDISNLGGKLAVGSMVVATNGKVDKREYRKFKIKLSQTPDDYKMISEVISRRLKNDWPKPDLMIIDGGRGQLNAALSQINKMRFQIPVISLAKRLEEIYTPLKVLPISLPKESPARQLVQALRDEAHRFAINYHRLLRAKNFLGKN